MHIRAAAQTVFCVSQRIGRICACSNKWTPSTSSVSTEFDERILNILICEKLFRDACVGFMTWEASPGRVWSGGRLWPAPLTSRLTLTEAGPHRSSTETPCQRKKRRKGGKKDKEQGIQSQTRRVSSGTWYNSTHMHRWVTVWLVGNLKPTGTLRFDRLNILDDNWKMMRNHRDSSETDNCSRSHGWCALSVALVKQ